jgi:hypothetical protein
MPAATLAQTMDHAGKLDTPDRPLGLGRPDGADSPVERAIRRGLDTP